MSHTVTDFYALLGVERSADEQAIKGAYRRLSKKYHPDRHPGDDAAVEHYKAIQDAYEVLSNPTLRREYDETGSVRKVSQRDDALTVAHVLTGVLHGSLLTIANMGYSAARFDVVEMMRHTLREALAAMRKQRNEWYTVLGGLTLATKRFKGKDTLLHDLSAASKDAIVVNIKDKDATIALHEKALRCLDDYAYDWEKPSFMGFSANGNGVEVGMWLRQEIQRHMKDGAYRWEGAETGFSSFVP